MERFWKTEYAAYITLKESKSHQPIPQLVIVSTIVLYAVDDLRLALIAQFRDLNHELLVPQNITCNPEGFSRT